MLLVLNDKNKIAPTFRRYQWKSVVRWTWAKHRTRTQACREKIHDETVGSEV